MAGPYLRFRAELEPAMKEAWGAAGVALSKKKCFSIALRHTLVVLEMH